MSLLASRVHQDPVRHRVEVLADDVGRLRRRIPPETEWTGWIVERICDHVDALDSMLAPTAADLYCSGWPLEEALAETDANARRLRRRLGIEEPA